MTDSRAEFVPAETAELKPLPGPLNLLGGDAAGYCSGGVCHIPGTPAQKESAQGAE